MKRTSIWLLCAVAFLALSVECVLAAEKAVTVGEYAISGPFTHDNLTIFLIHGKDKLKGKTFMTLDEALKKKVAVVHETGDVSQLSIENKSRSVHIYVQSGVIVKGGKQDRTLQYDMILAPRSGKVPVKSFCVESGRWSKRSGEAADKFSSAKGNLSTKELKLATKRAANQQEVWNKVGEAQKQLKDNLGESVRSRRSASSLQLTLENKKLRAAAAKYTKPLAKIAAGKKNVIGYAFAINGEINSADIYGSHELFTKVWGNLLDASVVEAIAKQEKGKKFAAARAEAVKALILDAQKGKKTEKNLTKGAKIVIKESKKSIMFRASCMDDGDGGADARVEFFAK